MYRGRVQLGQTLFLLLQTTNASGEPAMPDDIPRLTVWDNDGTLIERLDMPVLDRHEQTGMFHYPLYLGNLYAAGAYTVTYLYRHTGSSYSGMEDDTFEVAAGGDADGTVVGMYFYKRPDQDIIVQQCESGVVKAGRNPV